MPHSARRRSVGSDTAPSLDYAKKILAEPEKTIAIPRAVLQVWIERKSAFKLVEAEVDVAAAALRAALGDAAVGTYLDETIVTCKMQSRVKKVYPPGAVYTTTFTTNRPLLLKRKELPDGQ